MLELDRRRPWRTARLANPRGSSAAGKHPTPGTTEILTPPGTLYALFVPTTMPVDDVERLLVTVDFYGTPEDCFRVAKRITVHRSLIGLLPKLCLRKPDQPALAHLYPYTVLSPGHARLLFADIDPRARATVDIFEFFSQPDYAS